MATRDDGQPALLKRRRTKIVATVGPATADVALLAEVIAAGADVLRLNFSHGDHEGHAAAYRMIREAGGERPVAVLADLCGPKIRVGRFPGGSVELRDGARVTITTRDVIGTPELIPSQYAALPEDVAVGCRVLLSDGLLELVVDAVAGTEVECTVVHGGTLGDRKGINLPDVTVSAPAVTPKDVLDARFATELGVDWLALSFVRSAADLQQLRAAVGDGCPPLVAKIERPEALEDIEEIIAAADALMVARGDLGVELPPETVPVAQRALIAAALRHGVPCIVATQMLESMIEHPQPTRAEVSDVSTAVFAGTDAVMLSGETATGAHPVRAVTMMDRIARRIEAHQYHRWSLRIDSEAADASDSDRAVAQAAAQLSRTLEVRAIVVVTHSGATAAKVAGARPAAPVVAATADAATFRRLALHWGVVPVLVAAAALDDHRAVAARLARELDLAGPGQKVLTVAGLSGREAEAPRITVVTA